jgi:hypothetical protein
MDATMTTTKNEQAVIDAIARNLMNPANGHPECAAETWCYSDQIDDTFSTMEIPTGKPLSGVCASLVKKGLAAIDDDGGIGLTLDGFVIWQSLES